MVPLVTRGERNNNPGNVRHGKDVWTGGAVTQTDPDFITFTDPKYGIRAIARILHNYRRQGLITLAQAIARWAPGIENDTSAYINDVCHRCGLGPNDIVDFDSIMLELVKAIIWHENGHCIYSDAQINEGVALSLPDIAPKTEAPMPIPPVVPAKSGWTPTVSTIAGGGLGMAVAQLIVAALQSLFHVVVSPETGVSIGMVCTAAIGYAFPDGGRK